jgi:hypothetical protein
LAIGRLSLAPTPTPHGFVTVIVVSDLAPALALVRRYGNEGRCSSDAPALSLGHRWARA